MRSERSSERKGSLLLATLPTIVIEIFTLFDGLFDELFDGWFRPKLEDILEPIIMFFKLVSISHGLV